ncbi:MAG: hypothetical protein LBQ06_00105, partial [Frankiaceae bacterium]|nr:hypothetical protein [Frankiaceae bacterium]
MGTTRIDTEDGARALAAQIRDPHRARPIAVVSTPAGRLQSFIDAEELDAEAGDLVEVYVLPTGDVSWAFSKHMVDKTQVYGGAGRVYPVGLTWEDDPYQSPLRFAFNAGEGRNSTQALISDALRCAAAAGLIGRIAPAASSTEAGEVSSFIAGRAVVRIQSGGYASIAGELTLPGTALEQVLRVGQRVVGVLDKKQRRLDIRDMIRPVSALPYQARDTVLARVVSVGRDSATLELHPGLRVEVGRDEVTSNDLDTLDSLMTVGEVLRARLVDTDPWALTLVDLGDDEDAVPAAALTEGGPPWLIEGLPDLGGDDGPPDDEPDRPASEASPARAVAAAMLAGGAAHPPAAFPGPGAAALPAPDAAVPPAPDTEARDVPTPAIFDRKRHAAPHAPASPAPAAQPSPAPGPPASGPTAPMPSPPHSGAPKPAPPHSGAPKPAPPNPAVPKPPIPGPFGAMPPAPAPTEPATYPTGPAIPPTGPAAYPTGPAIPP